MKTHKHRLLCCTRNKSLSDHLPLLQYMGTRADSSDESADEEPIDIRSKANRVYRKISPYWRSRQLSHFLWKLDEIVFQQRLPKVGCRRVAGTLPRTRIQALSYNKYSVAPPGLPRNCYNEDWLRTLWPHELDALQMQEHDYDFTILSSPPMAFPLGIDVPGRPTTTSTASNTRRFRPYPIVQVSGVPGAPGSTSSSPTPTLSGVRFPARSPPHIPDQSAASSNSRSIPISRIQSTQASSNAGLHAPSSSQSITSHAIRQGNRNVIVEDVAEN